MATYGTKPAPPNEDTRWRLVDATMRKAGGTAQALIESLHTVQETFGFLDEDSMRYVALTLRVPMSRVYGVATFYHFFQLKPGGRHTCVICLGTACYIKGAQQLVEFTRRKLDISPGETTSDGTISILTARCLGSCGLAPAVVYDHDVVGNVTPASLDSHLTAWTQHDI